MTKSLKTTINQMTKITGECNNSNQNSNYFIPTLIFFSNLSVPLKS